MTRICVAGAGAVGSMLAARLLAAGEQVTLLARGTRLAQLQRDGLRVDFGGERFAAAVTARAQPDFGVQDVIFTATKAHGLAALVPTLAPLIGPRTRIVPLVNGIPWWYFQGDGGRGDGTRLDGVGRIDDACFQGDTVAAVDPHGALRDGWAAQRLIGCVLYVTARLDPSGEVTVTGGRRLTLGDVDSHRTGPVDSPAALPDIGAAPADPALDLPVDAVAALLTRAGITATVSARIRDDLWTKVALNLATNPLSVVTQATLAELFTEPTLLPCVSAVIAETARVAHGYGARPTMTWDEMQRTGRGAGPFETSMLQDYRAGRPLELAAIASSVLELAGKIGEHMPSTQLIVNLCAHRAARRDGRNP